MSDIVKAGPSAREQYEKARAEERRLWDLAEEAFKAYQAASKKHLEASESLRALGWP